MIGCQAKSLPLATFQNAMAFAVDIPAIDQLAYKPLFGPNGPACGDIMQRDAHLDDFRALC